MRVTRVSGYVVCPARNFGQNDTLPASISQDKTKPTRERSMLKVLDKVRKYIAIALLGLMAIVVVSATLEVAYEIVINMFDQIIVVRVFCLECWKNVSYGILNLIKKHINTKI